MWYNVGTMKKYPTKSTNTKLVRTHRFGAQLSTPEKEGLRHLQVILDRTASDTLRYLIAEKLMQLGFADKALKIFNEE